MSTTKINNAWILCDDFQFREGSITILDDRIKSIGLGPSSPLAAEVENIRIIDAKGKKVIPGLIDVHMHGYSGVGCSNKDPEQLRIIGQGLVKDGVTGYAASISTTFDEIALPAIDANVKAMALEAENITGAKILGIHMEGPFMNPVKKGAMNPKAMVDPSVDVLKAYLDHAKGNLKIMTMAPEMPGAKVVIETAVQNGVKISMGHTNATRQEALNGVLWGATRATHTFNAMRSLNHRESGVLGVVLTDDTIECELIADFVHVAKEVCLMVYRLKGADRITLISDSTQLAGLKQEDLPKDLPIILRDAAYLSDGVTLCGSISSVMTCVRNMVLKLGLPMEECIKMASYNPARDLGREEEVGSLKAGKKADLSIVDDDLTIHGVFVDGKELVTCLG